ncbi:MAG TPA: hypothetical protein ACFCUY_04200 [Xenococcaceae cyanobacterium]
MSNKAIKNPPNLAWRDGKITERDRASRPSRRNGCGGGSGIDCQRYC